MLIRRRVKATVSSNLTPSAIVEELTKASNKIYTAYRNEPSWIIGDPKLISYWDNLDELKSLKDLITKAQFISRFRIKKKES